MDPDQQGGSVIALPPDPELRSDLAAPTYEVSARGILIESKDDLRERLGKIATTIVRALDIEIGGVDIIESAADGSLYFLEVNINPGWAGLDATLGTNTASAIADYFESRVKSSNTASL